MGKRLGRLALPVVCNHYACVVSTGNRWIVSPPLPKAPPGYDGPPPPDDAVNVLIILDPSEGCALPTDPMALTHPVNRFVDSLARRLGQLANLSTWVATTRELRYEEDLPTGISAVVTNDATYAEWCHSWGGNAVKVGLNGDSLVVADRAESRVFRLDDLEDATSFAMGEVTRPSGEDTRTHEGARDAGLSLLEPISVEEIAGTEPILEELWRAIDHEELTVAQQAQIRAMAELLKAQQVEMIPGQTERWKLVGPMRLFLRYLVKEAPTDALAWWKLAELLTKINWSTLAGMLPG